MKRKIDCTALFFLLPSLIGVIVFVLLPFVDVLRRSLFTTLGGDFVGLKNYTDVIGNEAFRLAAGNTLRFTALCIPLLLAVSLLLALALFSCKKGRGELCKTAVLLPLAAPAASVVLIWQLLFHQDGLMNNLISLLGFEEIDFMNTQGAFYVLVVSYLWKNAGYDMVLWMAGLSGIDNSLYEAAAVDGAGAWKRFAHITVPSLIPTFFTIFVLSLLNSFKVFREAYLVAGEYPHTSMYLLQHLFNNWFVNLEIDKLCAAAVLMAAAVFGLILLLQAAWGGSDED